MGENHAMILRNDPIKTRGEALSGNLNRRPRAPADIRKENAIDKGEKVNSGTGGPGKSQNSGRRRESRPLDFKIGLSPR